MKKGTIAQYVHELGLMFLIISGAYQFDARYKRKIHDL